MPQGKSIAVAKLSIIVLVFIRQKVVLKVLLKSTNTSGVLVKIVDSVIRIGGAIGKVVGLEGMLPLHQIGVLLILIHLNLNVLIINFILLIILRMQLQ